MFGRRVVPWVLTIALVGASALVLILSKRLHDLSAAYRELRQLSTLPHAGTVVPTFRTATLAGDSVTVGEMADSTAKQVLFVFNTTCPFCRSIIPIWHEMADSLRRVGRPVQVLAISLDPVDTTRLYVSEHKLRYPVLTFPQAKFERLYRAAAVPQTVVLDWTGTVLYARVGTLEPVSMDSVFAAVAGRLRE
jgi:peroxiredoxin